MRAITLITLLWSGTICAQNDSAKQTTTDTALRRKIVWSANIGLPVGVHAVLYQTWYSNYSSTSFHWTNDKAEWLQMDKVGHAFSGYIISISSAASFRYAQYSRRKSALMGAAVAMGFQSAIEYFDGHSSGWGASGSDLIANTAGIAFGGAQAFIWGRVKVPFRITFRTTALASIRPELLGTSLPQRLLKDYNGQTYWLDFNPYRMGFKPKWWPRWFGVSTGYSAEGMLGGYSNVWVAKNGRIIDWSSILRYRQFFLSPSVALGHIKTKSRVLNALLLVTNYWRIPMPTVEFNSLGVTRFHWIYW